MSHTHTHTVQERSEERKGESIRHRPRIQRRMTVLKAMMTAAATALIFTIGTTEGQDVRTIKTSIVTTTTKTDGRTNSPLVVASTTPGGYDEVYGYPKSKVGGLIIEGPFPYKNGPSTWSDTNRWGAYGLIAAAGTVVNGTCPPIPTDSPFYNSVQRPVQLTNGVHDCLIGCNLTQVERTGHDPCHIGDLSLPLTNSPMSCFDVGPGMAGGWGLCGYNCSIFQGDQTKELTPCSAEDIGSGKCFVYCDSTTFPTETNKTMSKS